MSTSNRCQEPRLDTLQGIELAEGVKIHLRMAGPYVRVLAYVLDLFVRLGVMMATSFLLLFLGFIMGFNVAGGFMTLLMFFMVFFYYIYFESGKRGASPGKRIMGLRVVDTSGAPLSFGQAFIRNMLRFVDIMPASAALGFFLPSYGFGLMSTLMTKKFQRLGDLLANTVVVYDRLPKMLVTTTHREVVKSIAPGVPLTREEQAALAAFSERSGMWSEDRRVELANHASALTGSEGKKGMVELLGMAHWLAEKNQ